MQFICVSVNLTFGHHELLLYMAVFVHLKTYLNEYQIIQMKVLVLNEAVMWFYVGSLYLIHNFLKP